MTTHRSHTYVSDPTAPAQAAPAAKARDATPSNLNDRARILARLINDGSTSRRDIGMESIPNFDEALLNLQQGSGLKFSTADEVWHRGAMVAPVLARRWTLAPDSRDAAKELFRREIQP